MRVLKDAGLVAPDEIPTDEVRVPLDFTELSNKGVGELHSHYAVRHAHAIFQAALNESRLVHLKRDLRIEQSKFRIRNKAEKKNVVDAMMEDDERIAHLLSRISEQEAILKLVSAVAEGYEDFRNAASREMSRRIGERPSND